MARVTETEVMHGRQQAIEYALATTSKLDGSFCGLPIHLISYMKENIPEPAASIADLGAGPCGYHADLYELYPGAVITAYEASDVMVELAANYTNPEKTVVVHKDIRSLQEAPTAHDVVIASLLLHQIADPGVFWQAVKSAGAPGGRFVVFDLLHVPDDDAAQQVVDSWTPSPVFGDVFRNDFKNSLRAAFTVAQVESQLEAAKITARVTTQPVWPGVDVFFASGTLPA